jgi:glucose/arabinose dehydrogenase
MLNRELSQFRRTGRFALLVGAFIRITFAQIDGTWVFSSQIPIGTEVVTDIARIELQQSGNGVSGVYSGALGQGRRVSGTYSGEQVSLTVEGEWPTNAAPIGATLNGTLSAISGSGALAAGPAQGAWTARRPDPGENLEPRAAVTVDYTTEKPGSSHKISPTDLPKAGPVLTLTSAPKLVPRPADAWPKAPEGFQVSLYAEGFDYPRKIQTAPNGDVFLAESHLGEIKVLRGVTREGKAASVSTFATGLDQPFGIAFYPPGPDPQYVYIANTGSVVRFPYVEGDLKARGEPEAVITDLPSGGQLIGGGHWTRDLAFSKEAGSLYVSVGSFSENDNTDDNKNEERRADVLEYTPEGRFLRIYASGLRNPVGIAIDPRTGRLWASVNERDMQGNDLVPDFITHLEPGGFYGWPWFYVGSNYDPKHQGKHAELVGKVLVPDVLVQAHSASLTMTFYDGRLFPEDYRGDIFAAQHGSWNRGVRTGYEVIRVRLDQGRASGEYEDFLTGFVTADGQVWGRPVGVTVALDGSLLISDDGSRSVWRVTRADREDGVGTVQPD